MAKKPAKTAAKTTKDQEEEILNPAKGKCFVCGETEGLRAVVHYKPSGKRTVIRKCRKHYERA